MAGAGRAVSPGLRHSGQECGKVQPARGGKGGGRRERWLSLGGRVKGRAVAGREEGAGAGGLARRAAGRPNLRIQPTGLRPLCGLRPAADARLVRNRIFLARKYLPFPFVFFYLAFWLFWLLIFAMRSGTLPAFIQGVKAGVRLAKQTARTPLNQEAIKYLREHFGRLWY